MMRRYYKYRWLLATWLIVWGCTMSSAFAAPMKKKYTSWGYAPIYYSHPVSTGLATAPTTAKAENPVYEFRSTSPYTSIVSKSVFSPLAAAPVGNCSPSSHTRRACLWDEDEDPDDNPLGNIDDPAPVGSPLVLLLFALLYLGYKNRAKLANMQNIYYFCSRFQSNNK